MTWQGPIPLRGRDGPPGREGDAADDPVVVPGPAGQPGAQGVPGDMGPPGTDGEPGEDPVFVPGQPGPTGATGAAGATGPKGDKGDAGDTGSAGPQGVQGQSGPPGPFPDDPEDPVFLPGPQGLTGSQGVAGPAGPMMLAEDGEDAVSIPGPTGVPGSQGVSGPPGPLMLAEDGEDGVQLPGPTGAPGLQGIQGTQGPPGPFPDDPEDPYFLPGPQGVAGAQGVQGPAAPFLVPEDGEDGVQLPGPTGSPGLQGIQGIQGPPGAEGDQGEDPYYLPGPQGVTGSQGAAGPPGAYVRAEDGEDGVMMPGPTGAPGLQGIQGTQGPPGSEGDQGEDPYYLPGPQGMTGSQGVAGPQGIPGLAGEDAEDAPPVRSGVNVRELTAVTTLASSEPAFADEVAGYDASAKSNVKFQLDRLLGLARLSPGGRLTLTSGAPVTTTDVTGATTVYYTPYLDDVICLWDGTRWAWLQFSEQSLALGTLTSGKPYDVFGFLSGGSLALELLAWTDDSNRATAVAIQDGRYCKSGDKTRLLLGSFYTTSTTATEDSRKNRYLSNVYNKEPRALYNSPGYVDDNAQTTFNVTSTTWAEANGGTDSRVSLMQSLPGYVSVVSAWNLTTPAANTGRVGLAIDSTATPQVGGAYTAGGINFFPTLPLAQALAAGKHYSAMLVQVGGGTMSVSSDLGRVGGAASDMPVTFQAGSTNN